MVDQSSRRLVGIAKDILVRIQDQYVPTDIAILDIGHSKKVPLLLGRPFLNTTHTELHVGTWHARFYIQGKTLSLPFNGFNMYKHDKNGQPKKQRNKNFRQVWQVKREQCSMIRIKYGPNQQGIKEVEIQPQSVEGPIKKSKRPEQKRNNLKKKEKSPKVVPTPPKREKVWKHKEEALESTTTPPK
jgi:hypothetical protein